MHSYLGEDVNIDDNPEGWDIGYQESRSHFAALLNANNDILLNDFVNDCEKVEKMIKTVKREQWKNKRIRRQSVNDDADSSSDDDVNDPEEAFLSIGQNLRQAFKKHWPLVRLNCNY